ncbi:MAG: T9SS type A sorting domain-containing protein [bacterium]|nr:T9SS type A sorting domain-containing protein [bacterium]
MKKVLLTALAALTFGLAAMAQKIDNSQDPRFRSMDQTIKPFNQKSLNKTKGFVSDWYSIMDMIDKSNVGTSLTGFVNFLTHDSLNKFIEDDGTIRYGGWQSVGQIIDPKDDLILNTDKLLNQLSRFNSYKCDSIAFQYLYGRNVDSISDGMGGMAPVTDTVFIAYFAAGQINKLEFNVSKDKLATVSWDYAKRLPANLVKMDTILLSTGANGMLDTTRVSNNDGGFENGWFSKIASFPAPAGMKVVANPNGSTTANLVGFSYTFKSGIPAVIGTDTAVMVYQKDPTTAPAGMRRTNYFGCRFTQNSGAIGWENKTFWNTSLFALKSTSYKDDGQPNSWKGYIAGNAFTQDLFLESWFHLTTDTSGTKPGVGFNEVGNVKISSIFPNPASTSVKVGMELFTTSDVTVSIVNLMGQEVSSLSFPNTAKGVIEIPVSLNNLTAGVYVINVTAGNSTSSQKLVVAE